jgi:ABC-type transport system involved in cytochrome bd biosynthesis fused ATPase/permease subunit
VQELVTEIERLRSLHESAVQDWRNACELMNKAEAEVERLTRVVRKANNQTEHFERCWYLRGDEIERLRALLLDVRPDVEYAYINASGEGKTTRLNKLNRIHAALKGE